MAYSSVVLADSPLLYWRLNDSGSTVTDSSGNGYTGFRAASGITTGQTSPITTDSTAASYLFDGIYGYLQAPTSLTFGGSTALTIEAWVRITTNGSGASYNRVISTGYSQSTTKGFDLAVQDNGASVYFTVANGSTYAQAVSTGSISGWTHLVGTYDGSTIRLYINGVLQTTGSLSGSIANPGTQLVVAAATNNPYNCFTGDIAEVAVYNSVLTQSRIQTHYRASAYTQVAASPSASGSTATASLGSTSPLPLGAFTGSSTLVAGPTVTWAVQANQTGASSLATDVLNLRPAPAVLAGGSAPVIDLAVSHAAPASLAGLGSLAPSLTATYQTSASVTGVGALAPTLTGSYTAGTNLAGAGLPAFDVSVAHPVTLVANSTGGAGLATLTATWGAPAVTFGASTPAFDLAVVHSAGAIWTGAAQAVVDAVRFRAADLTGFGTGGFALDLTLTHTLVASLAGSTTASVDTTTGHTLTASVAGVGSVAPSVIAQYQVGGAFSGVALPAFDATLAHVVTSTAPVQSTQTTNATAILYRGGDSQQTGAGGLATVTLRATYGVISIVPVSIGTAGVDIGVTLAPVPAVGFPVLMGPSPTALQWLSRVPWQSITAQGKQGTAPDTIQFTVDDPLSTATIQPEDHIVWLDLSDPNGWPTTNLIPNPTFAGTFSGGVPPSPQGSYFASGWSATASATALYGTQSQQLSLSNVANGTYLLWLCGVSLPTDETTTPIRANPYTWSVWVKVVTPLAGASATLTLQAYDSTNTTYLDGRSVSIATTAATGWVRYNLTWANLPAGTGVLRCLVDGSTTSGTNSGTLLLSGPQLEYQTFARYQLLNGQTGASRYPTPFAGAGTAGAYQDLISGCWYRQLRLFGGLARVLQMSYAAGPERVITVEGVGYGVLLQEAPVNLVVRSTADTTVLSQAVTYARATDSRVLLGMDTTTYVSGIATVDSHNYTWQTVRDVLDTVANQTVAAYWVDAYNRLHYGPALANSAPFALSDQPNGLTTFPMTGFRYDLDSSQSATSMVLEGSSYLSAPQTQGFTGDGSTTVFTLNGGQAVTQVDSLTVAGTGQTVGLAGTNQFAQGYTVLLDPGTGKLTFQTAPAVSAVISCTYRYAAPLVVRLRSTAAAAPTGTVRRPVHRYQKVDTITSLQSALDRLNADLNQSTKARPVGTAILYSPPCPTATPLTQGMAIPITYRAARLSAQLFQIQAVKTSIAGNPAGPVLPPVLRRELAIGFYRPDFITEVATAQARMARLTQDKIGTTVLNDVQAATDSWALTDSATPALSNVGAWGPPGYSRWTGTNVWGAATTPTPVGGTTWQIGAAMTAGGSSQADAGRNGQSKPAPASVFGSSTFTANILVASNSNWTINYQSTFGDIANYASGYYWGDRGGNGELESYQRSQIQPIAGGGVNLVALNQVNGSYPSGMMTTYGYKTWGPGIYVSSSIRIPAGQGLWPAFWLLSVANNTGNPDELDIFENLGYDPTTIYCTGHTYGGQTQIRYSGVDLSQGFHVYGCWWESDIVRFYLDGVQIGTISSNIPTTQQYLLWNLAVGGNWPGNPNGSTPFPSTMTVQNVTVWTHGSTRPSSPPGP